MSQRIQLNKWVLLEQPNQNRRLVHVKLGEKIDLGRYGSFCASELLGLSYDHAYEITKEGKLMVFNPDSLLQCIKDKSDAFDDKMQDDEDGEEPTNEHIFDTNTSQLLTNTDINSLKTSLSTSDLIQTLVSNSITFTSKNSFSRLKYITRKARKYSRFFIPRLLTPSTLVKQLGLFREDALAHALFALNLQGGGRYGIWDDYKNVWVGAAHWRCPSAELIVLHQGTFCPSHLSFFVTREEWDNTNILPLSLDEPLSAFTPKCPEAANSPAEERHTRKLAKQELALQGSFTGLFIAAVSCTPLSVLQSHYQRLDSSSKLVLFHQHSEFLSPCFEWLRKSKCFVDVKMEECWLQPWQADPGRMHPMMSMDAHGGFILSAIKVTNP